ncbi:hypothetical protein LXM25_17440 [Dyadobacter sp. LJ53]|uniref:DoxX family protein n=1 Tax=Dyadobacter chenwenxiniae TaxID=2906456 RepID=UPI001F193CBD|nr:hypothetical protein [Dyadobacter chenwenxiniae]MCF0051855.1 hypothetical protein [Dyadobacter chenwenxiniae]
MKPFALLLIVFALTAIISKIFSRDWNLPLSGNLALGVMLCFTALGHFMFTKGMSMMIPDFIPFKKEVVYFTGVLEIILGLALLFPTFRPIIGIIIIVFFILILPANIYAAIKNLNYEKGTFDGEGLRYLWFRVPLQLFFIAWVWFFAVRDLNY